MNILLGYNGSPRRPREFQQFRRMFNETFHEAIFLGHMAKKSGLHGTEAHPVLGCGSLLKRTRLKREDLCQEVTSVSDLRRYTPRLPTVAGNQPPQPFSLQN